MKTWDYITNKTLLRGGIALWLGLAPLTILAVLLLPFLVLFAPLRSRHSMRVFDELTNTFWFGGSSYESLSSHAWKAKNTWWGAFVVWITDLVEPGHCKRANEYEQRIVEFVESLK